jgi:hypothetical protein
LSDPMSGELSTSVVAGLAHSAGMLMGSPVGFWYVGAEMDKSPHRASRSALSSDLPLDGDGRMELRIGAMLIDNRNAGYCSCQRRNLGHSPGLSGNRKTQTTTVSEGREAHVVQLQAVQVSDEGSE